MTTTATITYFASSNRIGCPPQSWSVDSAAHKALLAFQHTCAFSSATQGADDPAVVSCFHSVVEPSIPITDYVRNIHRSVNCGEEAVLSALLLIGRACSNTSATGHASMLLPSVLTAHRLVLVALRVVTKAHHDIFRSNKTFARAGGVSLQELNVLEVEFLSRLDFRVQVTQEEVDTLNYAASMVSALRMAPDRAAYRMSVALGITFPDQQTFTRSVSTPFLRPSLLATTPILASSPDTPLTQAGSGANAVRLLRSSASQLTLTLMSSVSSQHPISPTPTPLLEVSSADAQFSLTSP